MKYLQYEPVTSLQDQNPELKGTAWARKSGKQLPENILST